jgi:peptidoglycan-associated lipoprotein
MITFARAALMVAALAVAGCSNTGFGGSGSGSGFDTAKRGGDQGAVPGSASDPQSPLYFQSSIGDRVLFAVDQSSLGPDAKTVLDGQADWLLRNADYKAVIEGHADEQGTREYNLALGARRANAVREYLINQGVPGARLRTVTYGKERPIEICSDEGCYSKNRRAVTVLSADITG